jgi:hypothetical protein
LYIIESNMSITEWTVNSAYLHVVPGSLTEMDNVELDQIKRSHYFQKTKTDMTQVEWALFLTLATFPRVWIRPSKHGNHKVIVQGESKKTDTFDIQMNNKGVSFFLLTLYNCICTMKQYHHLGNSLLVKLAVHVP